jgi:hypothetical protein
VHLKAATVRGEDEATIHQGHAPLSRGDLRAITGDSPDRHPEARQA